jgi:hypothetical protein
MKKNIFIIIIIALIIISIINFIIEKYPIIAFFKSEELLDNDNINFDILINPTLQKNKINLYYINLQKSIDRNNRFLDRIQKFNNYNVIRFNAISPNNLNDYQILLPDKFKNMDDNLNTQMKLKIEESLNDYIDS